LTGYTDRRQFGSTVNQWPNIPTTHCKPILAFGAGELFRASGVDGALPDGQPDPGLIIALDTRVGQDDFVACHRHTSAFRQRNRSATRLNRRLRRQSHYN
jgi:hypothetical protein